MRMSYLCSSLAGTFRVRDCFEMANNLIFLIYFVVYVIGIDANLKKKVSPPHCTQVTKDTDYVSYYKLDYPVAYILPGQHEAYQKMYCLNPPSVNKAVTIVCDWAAPPQVQFTLTDDFVHVVRQDPTGRFLGNAVINTYQLCGHNISHVQRNDYDVFVGVVGN